MPRGNSDLYPGGSDPSLQGYNLYPGGSAPAEQYLNIRAGQPFVRMSMDGSGIATSPAASAMGLLEGAGETIEADPRGGGGFDLVARLYRVTARHSSEIAGIKQVI